MVCWVDSCRFDVSDGHPHGVGARGVRWDVVDGTPTHMPLAAWARTNVCGVARGMYVACDTIVRFIVWREGWARAAVTHA